MATRFLPLALLVPTLALTSETWHWSAAFENTEKQCQVFFKLEANAERFEDCPARAETYGAARGNLSAWMSARNENLELFPLDQLLWDSRYGVRNLKKAIKGAPSTGSLWQDRIQFLNKWQNKRDELSSKRRFSRTGPKDLSNWYQADCKWSTLRELLSRLQELDVVVAAEPSIESQDADSLPNDPLVNNNGKWSTGAWNQTEEDLWGMRIIGADYAWSQGNLGHGTIVALVDSGIDFNNGGHEDLPNASTLWVNPGEVVDGVDNDGNGYVDDIHGFNTRFNSTNINDPYGHATWVAGILAARINNSTGMAGVAPAARLMILKAHNNSGVGTNASYANAITYYADMGADVANHSWSRATPSVLIQDAFAYAKSLGVVQVTSAGNNSFQAGSYIPNSYSETITVSSTMPTDAFSNQFSNFGPAVDVAAPGSGEGGTSSNSISAVVGAKSNAANLPAGQVIDGQYFRSWGTSASAPFVSGLAAIVRSMRPALDEAQVQRLIEVHSDDLGERGEDDLYGHGRISVRKVVERLEACYTESIYDDCDRNSVLDACEIEDTLANDCDGDGVIDKCEIDCDENGVPDQCEGGLLCQADRRIKVYQPL